MTNPTTTNTTNTTTTASTGQNEMSWEAHPPPPISNHRNNRNRTKECVDDVDNNDLSNRYYHGKSLQTRWLDHENDELRYILQRWTGRLRPHKFAISMVKLYQRQQQQSRRNDDNATARMIAQQVIQITERFLQHPPLQPPPPPPPMINIFIVESLFRQHPKTQLSAIDYARHQLRQTPLHIPVAWGWWL